MDLSSPYPLEESAIQGFEKDGFVRLPDVLSPQTVAAYEPEITSKVIELNTEHLPMSERDTYRRAFLQVINLWRHSEQVRELVFSPRLAGIAARLLRVDSVRLYHDQALYKEGGGGHTPWHADQYYWPLSTDRCCTVWLPLQDTPLDMGPLSFAAGSHRFDLGRRLPIGDRSEEAVQRELAARDLPTVEEPYELGAASFHLGWTFHRAGPNSTTTPRRVMTIIYLDAAMTVAEPMDGQHNDLRAWMPGASPGDIPDTPLNPVLFPS